MTTQADKAATGRLGEELVRDRLVAAGWRVLDANWRSRARDCPGELDVVALDPDGDVVVVEVRTRRGGRCGSALESVGPGKVRRLRRLFGVWWGEQSPADRVRHAGGVRVDVVAVQLGPDGQADVEHVRGVG
ncbi:YraN family protein [Aquipuribacter sp. SD81]|uniref:YraN family protein n=1 Tax=Aquipuribacter sp. SD81 TaxID=3127703 RepID=UPI003019994D